MISAGTVKIVVQIVTHNNAQTIRACLRSVKQQKFRDYRLVVIDNFSTDNTRSIVKRLGVLCLRNAINAGYAAAHNKGIGRFSSEYVLTLNPDIVLEKSFLGYMVGAMDRAHADVGSAQALLYRVERMGKRSNIVDSAGLYMNMIRRQNLRYAGKKVQNKYIAGNYIFGPDGAAAFYRRAMLEDIDLGNSVFDEDYFMHKEDVDVCWRAQLRGWKSIFVSEAVGYHVRSFRPGQRANVHAPLRTMALRNRYFLMIKNDLPLLWIRDLPWIVLYDLAIFFYVFFRERESLPAYDQVLKNFGSMLEKRAHIQRSRKVGSVYMAQWFRWRFI